MEIARTWAPRAVGLAAFAVYALLAPPSHYWLDSAELSAAAVELGSAHPTGFPLYVFLAKIAGLVPLGELAFRINLMSAVCAAIAVTLTARLVQETARERDAAAIAGGIAAGAALAVSLTFLRQATVAEVYAPTAALLAAALVLVDRVARGGGARDGLALALVCGLGLAVHTTFALVGPVVIALLAVRLYRGARWPLAAPLAVVLVAGACYAYLPVRSATGETAAVDWDHPREAGGFVDHVTAARIRTAYDDEMQSTIAAVVAADARTFAGDLGYQLGPIVLLAAAGGVVWLARQRRTRWLAAALAVVALGDAVYSVWLNPMGLRDLQNGVPLALGVCVAAGAGVVAFTRRLGRAAPYGAAVIGVTMVVPAALASWPTVSAASSSDLPHAFAARALDDAPPRAIVLVQSDSVAAASIYATAVEGARPDVAVLVRQHLAADAERTRAMLEASGTRIPEGDDGGPWAWVTASGRPLVWEPGTDEPPPGTALDVGRGLFPVLVRADGHVPSSDAIARAATALRRVFESRPGAGDRIAARHFANGLSSYGRLAYGARDLGLADLLFRAALEVRPEHAVALVNRGTVAAANSDFEAALAFTEEALAIEPTRVTALVNAARYSLQLGDTGGARERLDRALSLDESRADAWALSALVHLNQGDTERGMEHLRRARGIDPRHPDVVTLVRQLEQRRRAPR